MFHQKFLKGSCYLEKIKSDSKDVFKKEEF